MTDQPQNPTPEPGPVPVEGDDTPDVEPVPEGYTAPGPARDYPRADDTTDTDTGTDE